MAEFYQHCYFPIERNWLSQTIHSKLSSRGLVKLLFSNKPSLCPSLVFKFLQRCYFPIQRLDQINYFKQFIQNSKLACFVFFWRPKLMTIPSSQKSSALLFSNWEIQSWLHKLKRGSSMLKTGQTYRHHHAKHYSPHSFGSLLDVQCWARIFLPQWTKTPRKKQTKKHSYLWFIELSV